MSEVLQLISALAAGSVLGYAYFYGLWWTVQQMPENRHPYRLMLISFFTRLTAVMAGFYLLLTLGWQLLAIGFLGFIITRVVVIRKWGLKELDFNKSIKSSDGV